MSFLSNSVKVLLPNTILREEVVTLGMCGENSLFVSRIGDWTWDAVARLCKVNPYDAKNDEGYPTYFSFCYYHIKGTSTTHLRSFGIGSEIKVTSSLYKCDPVSLHTVHRISKISDHHNQKPVTMEEACDTPHTNCLYVENYNRWISRVNEDDNEELLKAQPQSYKYDHLPQISEKYSPWQIYRKAITNRTFFEKDIEYNFVCEHTSKYEINIARDINGVGLLYFATYFSIFDEAVLQLWLSQGGNQDSFFNKKVVDQKICYLGNCNYATPLNIKTTAWQKNDNYIFNAIISRGNDEKTIAIITAKVIITEKIEKLQSQENSHFYQNIRNTQYVAPLDDTQRAIALMWQKLLQVDNVGIMDNFFQLGGHSLLAFTFLFDVQKTFGVNLSLKHLSKDNTLKDVAQQIKLLAAKEDHKTTLIPITSSTEMYDPFPLTDIQQAYYVGRNKILEMGKVATHFYTELKCDLSLDLERLNRSWQQIIQRHEMLRAVVVEESYQKVLKEVSYEIVEKDVASLSIEKQQQFVLDVRAEMSHQVFLAQQWPLFDIRVSKTSTNYYLHISIDFLMTDARSLQILFAEWQQLYEKNQTLPRLKTYFYDYLAAEKSTIQTNKLHNFAKEYWQSRISTLPLYPQLPLVKSAHDSNQKFHRLCFRLSKTKWQTLQKKAQQYETTPSAILISLFGEILALWSKNPRFILNLTLFNRLPLHPQVDQLIGDFTTSLLLEMNYEKRKTFAQRVHDVFQQLLSDLDHRYYSGVKVIRDLISQQKRPGDIIAPVVFTSTLGLAKNGFSPSHFGEETFLITQTSQAWLDCFVFEENDQLVVNWFYVKDMFPSQLMDVMFEKYVRWVEKFCDEDLWHTEIDIQLPQDQLERRKQLQVTKPIGDDLLHTLFLDQVKLDSEGAAVICGDTTLTYDELYKKSCAIANKLKQENVKANDLIAIVMEKGYEQVIAVMGILFSGAAYLPISPKFPEERIHYLLKDSKIILTQSYIGSKLFFPQEKSVIDVDTFRGDYSFTLTTQKKEDLAYVIYTSGSTGLPKGVAITHASAVNTILDINHRFQVTRDDRVLALSALNFDLSVYDIFGILAAGGCIVIPQEKQLYEPQYWQQLMDEYNVTLWNTVPALMQMLTDSQLPVKNNMRLVMLSGDWIPLNLPPQINKLWPDSSVVSLGGATEGSIWSIFYPVNNINKKWKSIPYGKPLTNQYFHILNKKWQDCPDWATGELFIGGAGVAKEYWKAPDITQKSFVYHPKTQERLYRTGDLGRYLPDGNIEFLGREDTQVKIHGYRIELGEIETHLNKHPLVEEAIVHPMVVDNGDKQLTAYVKSRSLTLELKLEEANIRRTVCGNIPLNSPLYTREMYLQRQSYRSFEQKMIPLSSLSKLLGCLLGIRLPGHSIYKYRYPSARGLYPVQTYIYIKPKKVQKIDGGYYYYHPIENYLEPLTNSYLAENIYALHNQPIYHSSAFAMFFIAHLGAIQPIYGEISHQLCLLEAGYMSQLLMDNASCFDIGLCPVDISPENFSRISTNFDLEKNDIFLHGFLGGKINKTQTQDWQQQPLHKKSSIQEINEFLQNKIPNYMLPKQYVFVDRFPLNSNGKIDKNQLPQPTLQNPQQISLPQTLVEKQIANIWKQLLQVNDIYLGSNFFDLGGHSITAIKVFREIEQKLNVKLPVATLFQHPTLQELSHIVTKKHQKNIPQFDCLVPIQVSSQGIKNFFMVHTAHGYVVEFYKVAEKLDKDINVYGFEAIGIDGKKLPLNSIDEMATKYINEMKAIQPKGPYYLAGRCIGGIIAYEMAQQLLKLGDEVDLLCIIEAVNIPGMEGYKKAAQFGNRLSEMQNQYKTVKSKIKRFLSRREFRHQKATKAMMETIESKAGVADIKYRERVAEEMAKARDNYTLLPYSKLLVLVYSCERRALRFFQTQCSNTQSHIIPSHHTNILLEPHVGEVAKIIKRYFTS